MKTQIDPYKRKTSNKKEAVQSWRIFFIVVIVCIFFHKLMETLCSAIFVKHFLSWAESNIWNDIIFIISTIGLSFWGISRLRKKYVVHVNIFLLWTFFVSLYSWYRISGDVWVLTPLSRFQTLKYLDIVYVPWIFNLLSILFFNPAQLNKESQFIEDAPLEDKDTDELKYEDYCKRIAGKINDSEFKRSFAIGITGEWGTGKSSFMTLIKRHLKDQIIFDFNPWISQDSKGITSDFFNSLSSHLSLYHSSISKEILRYGHSLMEQVDNNIISSLNIFDKSASLTEQFKNINSILKKVNKQVVVFMDDIDRLDETEVSEVIKLIRNTANFHNIVFIVAYDRNYLIESISKINKHRSEFFLEKIFQLEISLPVFEYKIIRNKLIESLTTKLGEDLREEIEESINERRFEGQGLLPKYINTIRDINRLTNSLTLNFNSVKGEVIFKEFFYIELVRLKFPSTYELLHRRQEDFFESKQEGLKKYALHLKSDSFKNIEESKRKVIVDLLSEVFNSKYYHKNQSHLTIRYPSNYYRYFAFRLLEGDLSEIAFVKARQSSQDEFNSHISQQVSIGLGWLLRERFEDIKFFDDKEDFEKVVRAIFHLTSQKGRTIFGTEGSIGYSGQDLYDKLYNRNSLVNDYYNGDSDQLKEFILSNFKKAKSPYLAEGEMVKGIADRMYDDNFLLSRSELESIVLYYLKEYLSETSKYRIEVWWLYNNCNLKKWYSSNGGYNSEEYIIPESKSIFINFIKEKDLKGFLDSILDYDHYSGDQLTIYNGVSELFDSWDNFQKFLLSFDETEYPYLKEYKDFFEALQAKEFKERIKYQFQYFKSTNPRR